MLDNIESRVVVWSARGPYGAAVLGAGIVAPGFLCIKFKPQTWAAYRTSFMGDRDTREVLPLQRCAVPLPTIRLSECPLLHLHQDVRLHQRDSYNSPSRTEILTARVVWSGMAADYDSHERKLPY